MNIFILDYDLKKCAKYHVDKHISKMIIEEVQLLSTTYYFTGQENLAPYKKTHINHPCAKWTRASLDNWLWLKQHAMALYDEYKYRYGKTHKSGELLYTLQSPDLISIGMTKFPQAMPEGYRDEDVVKAYRKYYNMDKKHLFKWKDREIPYWINK